jgi:hypothetical protein
MKRLTLFGLTFLLSSCMSNQADVRQADADKVAVFPAAAENLSACVHQATEALNVPYTFRLHTRPDKRNFLITATSMSKVITRRQMIGLELDFVAQGQATAVEMQEGVTGGWWLAPKVWPLIERCSEQVTTPTAANPPAP